MTKKKTEHGAFSPTFSLRRECSLAQASSLRLGESSKREQWCCHVLSLSLAPLRFYASLDPPATSSAHMYHAHDHRQTQADRPHDRYHVTRVLRLPHTHTGNTRQPELNSRVPRVHPPSRAQLERCHSELNSRNATWLHKYHHKKLAVTSIPRSNVDLYRRLRQCDSVAATHPNEVEVHTPTLSKTTFMFTKQNPLHKP
ncbi:hypothetical protein DEO72_LG5g911 [Vigna unguiculata]|uniref:Uncharacterized protein n=1 Tax=Vigna unguiculata TaxID=3917 RepID=A0A4D6LV81_VIGUN|nr:hypothetical protein DEO72_LG5g911 [Vigna unguiculata]